MRKFQKKLEKTRKKRQEGNFDLFQEKTSGGKEILWPGFANEYVLKNPKVGAFQPKREKRKLIKMGGLT